jgi:hypothetical protein
MKQFTDGTEEYVNSLESSGEVQGGVIDGTGALTNAGEGDTFRARLRDDAGRALNTLLRVEGGKLVDFYQDGPVVGFLRLNEGKTVHYRFDRLNK